MISRRMIWCLPVGILLMGALSCTSARRQDRVSVVEKLGCPQCKVLVVTGPRKRLSKSYEPGRFKAPEEAARELECETVICHFWFEHCEGVLVYWDDDGDGSVDVFQCDDWE